MFEEGDQVEIIPDSYKSADGTHAKGTVIEEADDKGHCKVEITEGFGAGTVGTFGEGSLKTIE
ncbi:hypothetical protein LCGC14_2202140 [marine sediment metagenome]|uniref:Uncharacterized protein n=1 Tax=marine sediment metagenome TaxID=412755 RepID=A0A0F9GCA6_9ZZZZ